MEGNNVDTYFRHEKLSRGEQVSPIEISFLLLKFHRFHWSPF